MYAIAHWIYNTCVTLRPATQNHDPAVFLATIGKGSKPMVFSKKQSIFTQGKPADAIFYLRTGKIKLTVVSQTGKEATIGILSDGSFLDEGGLAGRPTMAHG